MTVNTDTAMLLASVRYAVPRRQLFWQGCCAGMPVVKQQVESSFSKKFFYFDVFILFFFI
jgi:hypothetical protein